MPTTVADAFAAGGLLQDDVIRWGKKPSSSSPGVYIASLSKSTDTTDGSLVSAPLATEVFERWLDIRPELWHGNLAVGSRRAVLPDADWGSAAPRWRLLSQAAIESRPAMGPLRTLQGSVRRRRQHAAAVLREGLPRFQARTPRPSSPLPIRESRVTTGHQEGPWSPRSS
jgi:hypothetical protein